MGSPVLGIVCSVGMQTSTQAQAEAAGSMVRGGTLTCIMPLQGSKNVSPMHMGGDGSSSCGAGDCIGIRDARNITQAPLVSAQFSFTTKPERIILSHVCIVL